MRLLAVDFPGVELARAQTDARPGSSGEMVPIPGATIAHRDPRFLELVLPARCASARIDGGVRLRVYGRAVEQVVRLAPPCGETVTSVRSVDGLTVPGGSS